MAINYELLNKGGISLGTNFELLSEKPLDSRLVVPSLEGLQNYIDNAAAYEGMIAYVTSEKKHYEVKIIEGVLSYREFGLTQAELKDLIASETTAAMEFKGATATLPENPNKGDMWKVTASFEVAGETAKVGDSIVYSGEEWFLIPSGDDIEDTWRPVTGVNNDASLTFAAGDVLDVAIAANGTVTYSHEAIAAPELIAENEQTRTYITAVETDGHGHITGYKTATENVEDTNTEYTFESQIESSSVYFNVTPDTEGAAEQTIYVDAYSKYEVNTELAKKLDKSVYEAYIAGKEMSDADLKEYADDQDVALKAELIGGAEGETFESNTIHGAKLAASYEANQALLSAKGYADGLKTQIEQGIATADYVKKAEAPGYGDILTKTDAASTYAKITDLHSHDNENELDKIVTGSVTKWNEAYAHSQIAHAPANAQANIIESVKVNGTALDITNKAVDISVPTGALADKDKVAKVDLAEALATEIDSKVASVTAGDVSITVGGTATAPTVAVNLSAAEGNALTLAEDGLKVIIPESTKVEESETNGNIKVDGQEVTVYSHPDKHTVSEISDFETEIASYNYATKTEAQGYANAKDSAIATAKQAGDDAQDAVDALAEYVGEFTPVGTETTVIGYIDAKHNAQQTVINGIINPGSGILAQAKNYTDELNDGQVTTNKNDIAAIKEDIGNVDGLSTTSKEITGAINEVLAAVGTGGTAALVTLAEIAPKPGYAKTYELKQGNIAVGTIDIPKDMVVQSGTVETKTESGDWGEAGTYIHLVLANATNDDIYVNVGTLVDIYKAQANAAQVQIAINSTTREISATIVDGSVDTTALAANAVTTAKIADKNVTLAKLSQAVQDEIGKAHTHANETELNKIADGDVAKWNAAEQNAKDYADGLAGNYATAAQGDKADTAVQTFNNMSTDYISINGSPIASVSVTDKVKNGIAAAETALQSIGHGPNGYGKDELVISEKTANIQTIELSAKTRASLAKADSALQEHQDISGKTDKVNGATDGNFAGLDANGNLTDSGKKAADFVQSIVGASDTTGKGIGGIAASANTNGTVIVGLDTTAQANLELAKNSVQGATDGLKVNENKQVVFDDAVTFIFDCGGAEV